jgi:hypothetical protein
MIPHSSCLSAKCLRLVIVLLAFFILGGAAFAQTDNWTGTAGVWSNASNWDSGVPVAGNNISISTASASSTEDFSLAIGSLTLGTSADSLIISDGVALNASGPIANAGSIQLSSAGSNTYLQITGNVSLTGNGKVILGTTGPNYIVGASGTGTEVLTNSNTIQGVGNIGNGIMGLVNSGTIIANSSTGNLFINPSAANFSNPGTLEAITGGNLTIQGPANSFTNYNATTNTFTGGTYTANGGNIYFAGSASGITTLLGRVTQEASGQLINTTTGANAFANLASIPSGGVLTTTAGFTQPGAFSMAGSLNILPSTVINVGSVAQIKNNALTGGQWVLDQNLNITGTPANITTNSATVTLSGGTFKNTANGTDAFANLASNKKTLRIMNAARFTTVGTLTNSGSGQMTVSTGCKLTIGGSGNSYTQTGGKTTMDGLLIGAVNINNGAYLGAGTITGPVSVGGISAATFNIGDAGKAALVKIQGTFTLLSTGKLTASIGGTTAGTQYSQLQVMGSAASLAGSLGATVVNGFNPTIGETFTVLTASTIAGAFSNSTIAINASEHFAISYTATSVVLTVASGPAAQ